MKNTNQNRVMEVMFLYGKELTYNLLIRKTGLRYEQVRIAINDLRNRRLVLRRHGRNENNRRTTYVKLNKKVMPRIKTLLGRD